MSRIERFKRIQIEQPNGLDASSKTAGVEIRVVWHGTSEFLLECLADRLEPLGFAVESISNEQVSMPLSDDGSVRHAPMRRLRLKCVMGDAFFYATLPRMLKEIERVCDWVTMERVINWKALVRANWTSSPVRPSRVTEREHI